MSEHPLGTADVERVKEAHTRMTPTQLQVEGARHTIYSQGSDEGCYICLLLAQLASLTEENERMKGSLKMLARIRHDAEAELASERARADRNRDETLSTIKDLTEAEQRAARYESKIRAAASAFLDGRLTDLGQILDGALQSPNPESETDDG